MKQAVVLPSHGQQKLIEETELKIKKAKDDAESHFLAKMALQTEGFLRLFSEMTSRRNADIRDYLARFKAASEEAQSAVSGEIKNRLERAFRNATSKNHQNTSRHSEMVVESKA